MSEQRVVVVSSGGTIPPPISVTLSSGTAVAASVSGNVVVISGQPVSVSGNAVSVSGNIISSQIISGFNRVNIGGSGLLCAGGAGVGSAGSGGVILASCGPIISATLRSFSGNGPMMIGGIISGSYPNSGVGVELFAGETITLRVTNTNQISVYNESGNISGQFVNIITTCGYS